MRIRNSTCVLNFHRGCISLLCDLTRESFFTSTSGPFLTIFHGFSLGSKAHQCSMGSSSTSFLGSTWYPPTGSHLPWGGCGTWVRRKGLQTPGSEMQTELVRACVTHIVTGILVLLGQKAGIIGGPGLKPKEAVLTSVSAALQNAPISELSCVFSLDLV